MVITFEDAEPSKGIFRLPDSTWTPISQQDCHFSPRVFESVLLHQLEHPGAVCGEPLHGKVLYDSLEATDSDGRPSFEEVKVSLQWYNSFVGRVPSFEVKRTFVRQVKSRNPQLDQAVSQICSLLCSVQQNSSIVQTLWIIASQAQSDDQLPWYLIPRVRAYAYLHTWSSADPTRSSISYHYRETRDSVHQDFAQLRQHAQQSMSSILCQSQSSERARPASGWHREVISGDFIKQRYTELKLRHAERLTRGWNDPVEPSKHIFDDLAIVAFIIELWETMYGDSPGTKEFPGFVDIGCGNGVVVDILIREGYAGWGFDARERETWKMFGPQSHEHLKCRSLVPQPLVSTSQDDIDLPSDEKRVKTWQLRYGRKFKQPPTLHSHNGIFPDGTFIISNHADELTSWTPLLAALSSSPFICIPCCAHNLSGVRFRAPSNFNGYSADIHAPRFFASQISRSKSIAITTFQDEVSTSSAAERGDLGALKTAREQQRTSHASLCDWICNLSDRVGYVVERQVLEVPSTRNTVIVGRKWQGGLAGHHANQRRELINRIVKEEKADLNTWMECLDFNNVNGGLACH